MANWPATLPQSALAQKYNEKPPKTVLRTEMDAGPAKVRRRFTAGVRQFRIGLVLTKTQVATLDTFFVTTTNDGADQWTWKNPRTNSAANFRFVEEPTYTHRSGDYYFVQLTLEQLP